MSVSREKEREEEGRRREGLCRVSKVAEMGFGGEDNFCESAASKEGWQQICDSGSRRSWLRLKLPRPTTLRSSHA